MGVAERSPGGYWNCRGQLFQPQNWWETVTPAMWTVKGRYFWLKPYERGSLAYNFNDYY